MNTKQLKYVLVLAREGSFSRAAQTLNISQPSLSQYIRKIEKEVGMDLFDRSGVYVRLTDAGKVYIDAGRKILDLEHNMSNSFSDIAQLKSGTIVVGISPFRSLCIMPQAVKKFADAYPGIKIVVDERMAGPLLDGAEHGEFDLCICASPVNEKLFNCEHITDEEFLIAVKEDSKQAKKLEKYAQMSDGDKYAKIDIHLTDGESFVMLEETQLMQKKLDSICNKYDITLNEAVQCSSIESQLSMVKAGLGMALVPNTALAYTDGIKAFSVLQALEKREIVFISRKEHHTTLAINTLKQIVREVCSTL